MGFICLACALYALGSYEAEWTELPEDIQNRFMKVLTTVDLCDQTMSNVVYGLAMMKAEWDSLIEPLRQSMCDGLANENVFMDNRPQHVANTLW